MTVEAVTIRGRAAAATDEISVVVRATVPPEMEREEEISVIARGVVSSNPSPVAAVIARATVHPVQPVNGPISHVTIAARIHGASELHGTGEPMQIETPNSPETVSYVQAHALVTPTVGRVESVDVRGRVYGEHPEVRGTMVVQPEPSEVRGTLTAEPQPSLEVRGTFDVDTLDHVEIRGTAPGEQKYLVKNRFLILLALVHAIGTWLYNNRDGKGWERVKLAQREWETVRTHDQTHMPPVRCWPKDFDWKQAKAFDDQVRHAAWYQSHSVHFAQWVLVPQLEKVYGKNFMDRSHLFAYTAV
jgi:hypothetical protein